MTDKQDPHAELMELADDYAKSTHNDGIHGLSGVSLITEGAAGRHAAFARSVTDRLAQAEQEIVALTLSVSNRDARIAELEAEKSGPYFGHYQQALGKIARLDGKIKALEAQLEAVGAGGVGKTIVDLLTHIEDVVDDENWERINPALWNAVTKAYQPQQIAEPASRPQNCGTGYCSCIECPYPSTKEPS